MPRKTTDLRVADEQPDVLRLTPLELAQLMAHQARADLAVAKRQAAAMRHALTLSQKQAEALQMADKYRNLEAICTTAIAQANDDADAAKAVHNAFTQGLATKYKVDWARCGYNEETGVIQLTP